MKNDAAKKALWIALKRCWGFEIVVVASVSALPSPKGETKANINTRTVVKS